jgi:hypothetical protein
MAALAARLLRPELARAQTPPDAVPNPAAPDTAGTPAQGEPLGRAAIAAPTLATFLSKGARQWDVTVDGRSVCATPCTYPLYPVQFVTLRSREIRPVLLDVGRLPPGELVVEGKQLQTGMYAGGIVATTLGGMALATGITLGAVGYGRDRAGMITAGVITGGAGVVALTTGISFMLRALPNVTVDPVTPPPQAGLGPAQELRHQNHAPPAARALSVAGRF